MVKVELLGVYRKIAGKGDISIRIKRPKSLASLLQQVCEELGPKFRSALLDPELNDPRPNALILVNGQEMRVLDGLKTRIRQEDIITIIPISHGG